MRALVTLGRLDEVAPVLARHRALCERIGLKTGYIEEYCYKLTLALASGDFDGAEAAAEQSFNVAPNHPAAHGMYGLHMFAIRREQGRLNEAAPILELAARQTSGVGMWRPGLAVLYAEVGRLEDARVEFEKLAVDDFASIPRDSLWPATGSFLADVCIALEDRQRAELLYRDLLQFCDLNLMVAMTVCLGSGDRVLGGLASVLGRDDDADAHFRAGIAMSQLGQSPVWLAHVQHDWARHLVRRGDVADARVLADSALRDGGATRDGAAGRAVPSDPAAAGARRGARVPRRPFSP